MVYTPMICRGFLNLGRIDMVDIINQYMRGYSSVVEHSTADREVHGSTPCAP